MMRRVVVGSFHVAIAAALLRAGVAVACPQPPGGSETPQCTLNPLGEQDCTPSGALDLDVAFPKGAKDAGTGEWAVKLAATRNYGWGGVNVCDAMVLFQVSDDAASSDVTVSLQGSPSTALRNVRITKVEPVSTPNTSGNQALRYGSGAFCVWANEDYSVAHVGPEVVRVTVEAFDPQGNVHKGQALVAMTCTASATGTTSQQAYYQKNANGTSLSTDAATAFCSHMNTECVADATLPPTCGLENNVCQCSEIPTTPAEPPAVPGNVCVIHGDVYCGPPLPTPPGTPPGEVCINHGDTVCGPVSVCVTTDSGVVCGPASGPGSNPGEVCISREGTVCGPVTGSGSGPGNSGGDVCVSREGTVCGPITTDTGCTSNREGYICPGTAAGDVCVHATETTCGQVPVASSSNSSNSSGSTTDTSSGTSTGTKAKSGCAAFPGADLSMGLMALLGLGLGALRRRR